MFVEDLRELKIAGLTARLVVHIPLAKMAGVVSRACAAPGDLLHQSYVLLSWDYWVDSKACVYNGPSDRWHGNSTKLMRSYLLDTQT